MKDNVEVPDNQRFVELEKLCESEGQFKDLTLKLSLLEVIISQVNEIFISSLYAETGQALIDSTSNSIKILQDELIDKYIENSVSTGQLMPVPEIENLTEWVENIHLGVITQLYSKDFVESVFAPALATISQNIIDFSKEEEDQK